LDSNTQLQEEKFMRRIFESVNPNAIVRGNVVKAFALCFALVLPGTLASAQQTRTFITYTTGIGTASESDQDQALNEATQQAQNTANSTCTGTVTASTTNSSNCSQITNPADNGVTYTCVVVIKDTCQHP
jgi:hypothetical protein